MAGSVPVTANTTAFIWELVLETSVLIILSSHTPLPRTQSNRSESVSPAVPHPTASPHSHVSKKIYIYCQIFHVVSVLECLPSGNERVQVVSCVLEPGLPF